MSVFPRLFSFIAVMGVSQRLVCAQRWELKNTTKNVLQKRSCRKGLQNNRPKIQNRFFLDLFNHVFGRFSVGGVKKKILKKSDPGPFLIPDPPTHHGGHRFFSSGPLAWARWWWRWAWAGLKARSKYHKATRRLRLRQGAGKKKSVTPVVGGWVRVRKRTRVRFIFWICFLSCFLNSPHRETPKNVIKKIREKNRFWIFGRIFCKNVSTRFFAKRFL
jgi:hypothetical protein